MPQNILLQQGWLSVQPEYFREAVLSSGRVLRLDAGKTVFAIGDPPGGAYAILRGEVAIEVAPGKGGPHFMHIATPGAWLGEISFLTGQPRRITVRTVVETELFHLPLDVMQRLTRDDSDATRRLAQILVWNVDATFRKIEVLLDPDPARRIIRTLLHCLGEQSSGQITLSQNNLARMANVSRNTVVRVLRGLAQKSWVRTGYGRIEILEPQKLARFSDTD